MRFLVFLLILISTVQLIQAQTEQTVNVQQLRAYAFVERGHYAEALPLLTDLLTQNPGDVQLLDKRGQALFALGKYQQAIADFLLIEQQKKAMASLWIARCYAMLGETDKSLAMLTEHLQSKYRLPQNKIMSDKALASLETTDGWKQIWSKNWYTAYEMALSNAEYAIKTNSIPEAYAILDPLLAKRSRKHEAYYLRAKALLADNDLTTARKDINAAIKIKHNKAEYLQLRAQINSKKNNKRSAVRNLNQLIEATPYDVELYMSRATLLLRRKKYERTTADLHYYLACFPDDLKALNMAGNACFGQKKYIDALQYHNQVIEREQGNAKYYTDRANAFQKSDTHQYAISDYSKALDLTPNNPAIYFNRALSRLSVGDQKGACIDLRRADEIGYLPAYEYIKKNCR